MRVRRLGACLAALTILLAGLAVGLATAGTPVRSALPTGQAGILTAQVQTAAAPGVPTTSVTTATSTDVASPSTTTGVSTDSTQSTPATTTVPKPAPATGAAVGNAALAPTGAKRIEAARSCAAQREPTYPLLSVGSAVSGGRPRSLTKFLIAIAALAALVAFAAIGLRRRRAPNKPKTLLELTASTVAILGTLASLAVAYLGAGVKEHPPPAATMVVREVHARITHGAYLDKMRGVTVAAPEVTAAKLRTASATTLDRLEIGNVVWLELDLTGYRKTNLQLQWALFHAGAGAPLIPDTEHLGTIKVDDSSDVHDEFLPIWIGSPRVPRFRVEFRLLDRGQVRQIASTGAMQGIAYRYAC